MKRFLALCLVVSMMAAVPAVMQGGFLYASAWAEGGYTPLQYGDQGELVTQIQKQLAALGYYTGKVSGNFLDGTRAAVTRFQKDYGLEETGVVNGETETLLLSAEYRVLSRGSSGDDVVRVQEHLQALEYYNGKISGDYLEGTQAGIRAFQERNGLNPTGEADIETQQRLFGGEAVGKNTSADKSTPNPDEDVGDINDVVMVEDGEDNDQSLESTDYSRKLTRGAKGNEVKQVQQRLTDLGYFDGPVSGNYMNQTMAAMKQFQFINGLKDDGITGEATWTMLFSAEALNVGSPPRPTPEPTPVPYAVTVDVKNQAVIVYGPDEKGEYTVPVRRMVCSTGKVGSDSDLGDWVLDGRKARWAYFSLYGGHAQYWTRINKYIAFHSVLYNQVNTQTLRQSSYNMLGSRASRGCIRMLVSEAKWMYENIGEGVVVTIRDDLPADEELRRSLKPPPLNTKTKLPVSTPQPTAEPNYTSDGQPPQPFRTLKKGRDGEDVYWLQRKLQELGYYTGTVTGAFYGGTEKAVKAFQKDNKIRADGIAGENTLMALYESVLNPATPEPSFTLEPDFSPAPVQTPVPSAQP